MKKALLWAIPAVVIIVAAAGYLFMTRNDGAEPVAEESTPQRQATLGAELVFTEGTVEYRSGEKNWTHATTDVSLREGDAVEVIGEGKAIINLDDGSVVRLNEDSGITLTSLDPNRIVVTNDKGEVYTRVVTSDRVFEVATADTIYESLGTAYQTYNKEDVKGVEVYHNKVKVKDRDGKEKLVVDEGKMYFDTNKEDRALEKKVEDIPEKDIKENTFIAWNASEDDKSFKDEMGKLYPALSTVEKITLRHEGGGNVSWTVQGDSPKGYKIVWSKNANPEYPTKDGDQFKYIDDPGAVSGSVDAFDGSGTYYVRVCEYLGGECGVYSNQVTVTLSGGTDKPKETVKEEPEQTGDVSSISLSHVSDGKVKWSANGYSESGFKVVWSKNSGPTYPTRSGDQYIYDSNPSATTASLNAFSGTGTYYVRVCEYLGGKCGVYSNQITVQLTGNEEEKKTEDKEDETNVTSISLSGSGKNVSWSVAGHSPSGFKIVWSKNSGPTYPTRSGDEFIYDDDPNATSASLNAFDGSGTYYVRVCEYLGGKCGVYSNQITVELSK